MDSLHKHLLTNIKSYVKHGFLNTIVYGDGGVGKNYVVTQMLNNSMTPEKEIISSYNEINFFSTSKYIKFDAAQCQPDELLKAVEEISSTKNYLNQNKVIYIRNVHSCGHYQKNLRQLIEDTFHTTRYVFTTHNLDTIDTALKSRCMLLHVPPPTIHELENIILSKFPHISSQEIAQIIKLSSYNLNKLNIILAHYKVSKKIPHIESVFANHLENKLSTNLNTIHSLAEYVHQSDISLNDAFKYMKNLDKIIPFVQKYMTHPSPSLNVTFRLFVAISNEVIH